MRDRCRYPSSTISNNDLLSVLDLAALIDADVTNIEATHVVHNWPPHLRRNPDDALENNLRELPYVDFDLLPRSERSDLWFEEFYRQE